VPVPTRPPIARTCLVIAGLALGVAACSPQSPPSAVTTTGATGTVDGAVAVQPVQESGDDGAVDGVGDQVRVVGTGIATAVPDVLVAELSTRVSRPSVDEALAVSSERTAAVLEALVGAGVPEEDVQTRNVGVSATRSRNGDGPREITGYRATNQLSVRVADLDTAGDVLGAAADAGGNALRIEGVRLVVEDDTVPRTEARGAAVADARARAETLAEAAGRSLGEVALVSEGSFSVPEYRSYDAASAASAFDGDVPIARGEQDVSVTVTTVWRLE